jgi:hypothetical protein
MTGVKHDQEKPDYSLLNLAALESVVRVLMAGEKKYSRPNWQTVVPHRRYFAAMLRHIAQYQDGEAKDTETGESHLAHAVACLMFLLWHEKHSAFGPEKIHE